MDVTSLSRPEEKSLRVLFKLLNEFVRSEQRALNQALTKANIDDDVFGDALDQLHHMVDHMNEMRANPTV